MNVCYIQEVLYKNKFLYKNNWTPTNYFEGNLFWLNLITYPKLSLVGLDGPDRAEVQVKQARDDQFG